MLQAGTEIELTTTELASPGASAGRVGGRKVVVKDSVPGDRLRLRVGTKSRGAHTAEILERLGTNPNRRTPPCPHSAACGMCDLDQLTPSSRHQLLADRASRVVGHELSGFVASPRTTGHRARLKLAVREGQVGWMRPRSHELTVVDHCLTVRPEINEALRLVRGQMEAVREGSLELRSDGTRVVAHLFGTREKVQDIGLPLAIEGKAVDGNPTLTLQVQGTALRASPKSFYQVNLELNELLTGFVLQTLEARAPEHVLDLYSGIGNFTLPLAERGIRVTAVEAEGQAIKDLKALMPAHVSTHTSRVERFDTSRVAYDAVIADPPRAGCAKELPRILRNRPRVAILINCHLGAAGRDVRAAEKLGYRVVEVRAFDMFPDTHHLELVTVLERC